MKRRRKNHENKRQKFSRVSISEKDSFIRCSGKPGRKCSVELVERKSSLHCDLCQRWFHRTCQQVSATDFNNLMKSNGPWLCQLCHQKNVETEREKSLKPKGKLQLKELAKKTSKDSTILIQDDTIYCDVTQSSNGCSITEAESVFTHVERDVDPRDTSSQRLYNIGSLDGNRVIDIKLLAEFISKFPCPQCLSKEGLKLVSEVTNPTMTVSLIFKCKACQLSRYLRDSNKIKVASSNYYVSESKYMLVGTSLANNYDLKATNEWLDGIDVPPLSSQLWHKCCSLWKKSIQSPANQDPLAHKDDSSEPANRQMSQKLQENYGQVDIREDGFVESDTKQEQDHEDFDAFEELLLEMDDIALSSVTKNQVMNVDLKPMVNLDIVKREDKLDLDDVQDIQLPQITRVSSLGKKVSLNNSVSGNFQSFGCTNCEFTTLDCDEMAMHITSHSNQINETHNLVKEENCRGFENDYFNSKENSEVTHNKKEAVSKEIPKLISKSINSTYLKSSPKRIRKSTYKMLNLVSKENGLNEKSNNKKYEIEESILPLNCDELVMKITSDSNQNKETHNLDNNENFLGFENEYFNSIENLEIIQNKKEDISKEICKENSNSINRTSLKNRPRRITKSKYNILNLDSKEKGVNEKARIYNEYKVEESIQPLDCDEVVMKITSDANQNNENNNLVSKENYHGFQKEYNIMDESEITHVKKEAIFKEICKANSKSINRTYLKSRPRRIRKSTYKMLNINSKEKGLSKKSRNNKEYEVKESIQPLDFNENVMKITSDSNQNNVIPNLINKENYLELKNEYFNSIELSEVTQNKKDISKGICIKNSKSTNGTYLKNRPRRVRKSTYKMLNLDSKEKGFNKKPRNDKQYNIDASTQPLDCDEIAKHITSDSNQDDETHNMVSKKNCLWFENECLNRADSSEVTHNKNEAISKENCKETLKSMKRTPLKNRPKRIRKTTYKMLNVDLKGKGFNKKSRNIREYKGEDSIQPLHCDEKAINITSDSNQNNETHNLVKKENYLGFKNEYFNCIDNSEVTHIKKEAISKENYKENSKLTSKIYLKSRPRRIRKTTIKMLSLDLKEKGFNKKSRNNKEYEAKESILPLHCDENVRNIESDSNWNNEIHNRVKKENYLGFENVYKSIDNLEVIHNKKENLSKENCKETSESMTITYSKSRPRRIRKTTYKMLNLESKEKGLDRKSRKKKKYEVEKFTPPLGCDEMVNHKTSDSNQNNEIHNLDNKNNYLGFEHEYFNSKENSEVTHNKKEALSKAICKETSNLLTRKNFKSRPIRIRKSTYENLNFDSNE